MSRRVSAHLRGGVDPVGLVVGGARDGGHLSLRGQRERLARRRLLVGRRLLRHTQTAVTGTAHTLAHLTTQGQPNSAGTAHNTGTTHTAGMTHNIGTTRRNTTHHNSQDRHKSAQAQLTTQEHNS